MRFGFFARWGLARGRVCCVLLILALSSAAAHGQGVREAGRGGAGESVFLDTDSAAIKKLEAARDFIRGSQWNDAVDLLRQIGEQHADKLVAVAPGRYVNVMAYCGMLHARLPAEGLKVYRARIDPQARRWYEEAVRTNSESLLHRIVDQAFASSYGDQALLALGDRAWERGDLVQAQALWQKILPETGAENSTTLSLNFPDTRFDHGVIRARLILATLMQGNLTRGREQVSEFARSSPLTEGRLAGQQGRLIDLLRTVLSQVEKTTSARSETMGSTFAGNAQRNYISPREVDVGAVQWPPIRLKEAALPREIATQLEPERDIFGQIRQLNRTPNRSLGPRAGYFPVIHNDFIFACDNLSVYAWNLRTGKPAWPGSEPNSAAIYTLPLERRHHNAINRPVAGLPWFTVTVDQGRLYARLGSITLKSDDDSDEGIRPRNAGSFLVSLDIDQGEGKLVWILDAAHIETAAGNGGGPAEAGGPWSFEGTPVAAGDRVYVGLRRSNPRPQVNVACLDATTGRLIWNRKVCAGLEMLGGDAEEIGHQVLTLADNRVYCNTNLGAIAALEARDGRLRWVATYPHSDPENIEDFNRRQKFGPNPCLFHDGVLFAAPNDSEAVHAFDAETGRMLWDQRLRGAPRLLLGVADGKLIVSGDRLFALKIDSGTTAWRLDANDPEMYGVGRGALAGGLVYWPIREEILLVELSSGRLKRRVNLQEPFRHDSGNLVVGDGYLLIASRNRLIARCEYGRLIRQFRDEISRHPRSALPYYHLATAEEATNKLADAVSHFRTSRLLATTEDQWEGRPLRDLAQSNLFRLLMQEGERSLAQLKSADAAVAFAEASSLPVASAQRLQAHFRWATANELLKKFADSVSALQRVISDPELGMQRVSKSISGSNRQLSGARWSELEIDRLIQAYGRTIYAAQEDLAANQMKELADRGDLAGLQTELMRYPNAKVTPVRWLQLGREFSKRREFSSAVNAFRHSLDRAGKDVRRSALLELAQLAESRRFFRVAAQWWHQLATEFPQFEIPHHGKPAPLKTVLAERLQSPEYQELSANSASIGARRWNSPLPEGSHCLSINGNSPAAEWDSTLVVESGVDCVDLRTGRIRWQIAIDSLPDWAVYSSDLLIIGSPQELVAVEPDTGKTAWRHSWQQTRDSVEPRTSQLEKQRSDGPSVGSRETPGRVFFASHQLQDTAFFTTALRSSDKSGSTPPLRSEYRLQGEQVLCLLGRQSLESIDLHDGSTEWRFRPSAGILQPFWSSDARRITLQTIAPNQLVVLETSSGNQITTAPGLDLPWEQQPRALSDGRLACSTAPMRLQLFDPIVGRVAWDYPGGVSQAHLPPEWLTHDQLLFLVKDGITLTRVNPDNGNDLWSIRLSDAPLVNAGDAVRIDSRHVFVAASGTIRAYQLQDGVLTWEQYLGPSQNRCRILRLHAALAICSAGSPEGASVLLCDQQDGSFLQRLLIPQIGKCRELRKFESGLALVGDTGLAGLALDH